MTRLVKAELLKIRTTNTWWIFAIGLVVMTAITLFFNILQANFILDEPAPPTEGMSPEDAAEMQANWALQRNVTGIAANIFTSGQYFGGLFVLLIGILVITNEFHHQTATATFLTTPHRTTVILSKLITAMLFSVVYWLITEVMSLIAGSIFLNSKGVGTHLGDWEVQRAIILNAVVFMLWGIFGTGLGALIRNQLGATITATMLYTVGYFAASIVFQIIYNVWIKEDWVLGLNVIVPSTAAQIFTSGSPPFVGAPEWWVGGVVMLAYGVVAGAVGTLILRNRDIA